MSSNAVCTIVSANYLSYARTLGQSIKATHPDLNFYVLLVDEPQELEKEVGSLKNEEFEVVPVRDLGLSDFDAIAFKFGVVELNTNVKPSFLKYLFTRGIERLIYLDPDIFVYKPLEGIFDLLRTNSIILTPHVTTPLMDGKAPSEQDFMRVGVFNLGFIAVSKTPEGFSFLDWWENRCLTLGFNEVRTGLFVDQKWADFIPCFYQSVSVLRNPGYNMAYWNLHERTLFRDPSGDWMVNSTHELIFFHFSGIDPEHSAQLSRYQNRFDLIDRPDLKELFAEYRQRILNNGFANTRRVPYAFGAFTNGKKITALARALYAGHQQQFPYSNPFDASGSFYQWAHRHRLISKHDTAQKYNSMNFNRADLKVRSLNRILKIMHGILGTDRYTMLLKYLSYITVLRNQKEIFSSPGVESRKL